jgi:hypothetical protein
MKRLLLNVLFGALIVGALGTVTTERASGRVPPQAPAGSTAPSVASPAFLSPNNTAQCSKSKWIPDGYRGWCDCAGKGSQMFDSRDACETYVGTTSYSCVKGRTCKSVCVDTLPAC